MGYQLDSCFGDDDPSDGLYPCPQDLAEFACRNWHYSRSFPFNYIALFAAFEKGEAVGAVAYCRGVNRHIGKEFGLTNLECCELQRVAFCDHERPISEYLAQSLRLLKAQCPKIRLVVSYADSEQGHEGTIYQASNWIYVGASVAYYLNINGKRVHGRTANCTYGSGSVEWLRANVDPLASKTDSLPKHKYLMPLDRGIRRRIEKLRKPYPSAD